MNKLKYKRKDIEVMRPEIAPLVIANSLRRPIEGLPKNWLIEGSSPAQKSRRNAVKIGVTLVMLGTAAVVGLQGPMGLEGIAGAVTGVLGTLSSPPAPASPVIPPAPATEETTEIETVSPVLPVEPDGVDDQDARSVKPFVHDKPPSEEELDKTWLDKGITKFGKVVRAFFRIKI